MSARATVAATLRRSREIELGSCALILASQQLMCTIPLLLVLAAFRTTGGAGNFGVALAHYLGLSSKATQDLKAVFAGPAQVRSGTSAIGGLMLALFAVGTARAHQRGYELAWRLEQVSSHDWTRQLRWIGGLIAYLLTLATLSRAIGLAPSRRAGLIAAFAPVSAGFYWWSQYTLLGRRVRGWRLVPGALIIGLGVTALLAVTPALVSSQVTGSVRNFGLVGVTYALATWQLALSVLILGGALLGAIVVTRHKTVDLRPHIHPGATPDAAQTGLARSTP